MTRRLDGVRRSTRETISRRGQSASSSERGACRSAALRDGSSLPAVTARRGSVESIRRPKMEVGPRASPVDELSAERTLVACIRCTNFDQSPLEQIAAEIAEVGLDRLEGTAVFFCELACGRSDGRGTLHQLE